MSDTRLASLPSGGVEPRGLRSWTNEVTLGQVSEGGWIWTSDLFVRRRPEVSGFRKVKKSDEKIALWTVNEGVGLHI